MAVFPGDTEFRQEFLLDLRRGDNLTLSKMTTTVHLGAHADAPNHYVAGGASMEARSLKPYLGSVQVIEVGLPRGARIRIKDLVGQKILAPRILFKTSSFPNPDVWNGDFVALSAELIEHLAEQKVILVGIDTPSVDPADDRDLETHHAIAKHDLSILEGLVLKDVAPGIYQLIALPLKIEGSEATPVRAVLLKERG